MNQFPSYNLDLADNTHLTLHARDEQAAVFLALFATATKLKQGNESEQYLDITRDEDSLLVKTRDKFVYRSILAQNGLVNPFCLLGLSHIIAQQICNGFLLHGALAEYKNRGIILIAQGGTGKTTASKRLPDSWHSLSDDLTLVVCDAKGKYWAHPWPTWSRFFGDREGGTWDVQRAVSLHAIFHLSQAERDWVEPLSVTESIVLLAQSAEQAFSPVRLTFEKSIVRMMRLRRFNQIHFLTKSVPLSELYISLYGSFWQVLEDMFEKQLENTKR